MVQTLDNQDLVFVINGSHAGAVSQIKLTRGVVKFESTKRFEISSWLIDLKSLNGTRENLLAVFSSEPRTRVWNKETQRGQLSK